MRNLYVIEATAKPRSLLAASTIIPKRILYVDSEGWFVTASDQYDRQDQLWKTLVAFHAYRDRAVPNARVAIWPFKRMFETALVDEDLTSGFSTVVYSPGHSGNDDSLFENMGASDRTFFTPREDGPGRPLRPSSLGIADYAAMAPQLKGSRAAR